MFVFLLFFCAGVHIGTKECTHQRFCFMLRLHFVDVIFHGEYILLGQVFSVFFTERSHACWTSFALHCIDENSLFICLYCSADTFIGFLHLVVCCADQVCCQCLCTKWNLCFNMHWYIMQTLVKCLLKLFTVCLCVSENLRGSRSAMGFYC